MCTYHIHPFTLYIVILQPSYIYDHILQCLTIPRQILAWKGRSQVGLHIAFGILFVSSSATLITIIKIRSKFVSCVHTMVLDGRNIPFPPAVQSCPVYVKDPIHPPSPLPNDVCH